MDYCQQALQSGEYQLCDAATVSIAAASEGLAQVIK
jgi:hypothetical protein